MDTNKIKVIILGVVATFVALYLGFSAATAQFETIGWVLGSAVLIACISLGRKIWLLIPFMLALNIGLRIPGQPNSGLMGQILVLGFSALLFLTRKLNFRLAWKEMEVWLVILTLFVLQVYVRNPTGLNIFGSDTVGAKPYALYGISLLCGVLFAGLRVPPGELKWILRLSIVGGLLNLAVSMLGIVFPSISYYTGGSYLRADQVVSDAVDTGAATRIGYLGAFGGYLALWISSFRSPLHALLSPLWGGMVLIAITAAMMSGFRNSVMAVGMTFLLGIAYRNGFLGIVLSTGGLVVSLAVLALVNTVNPLPPNIQRSLTFLPGTWEGRYRRDAEGSNEWRLEIWKEALLSDRWIDNKWLGDGLGFKATELARQLKTKSDTRLGVSGFDAHRDAILASGDYHSGPVQTIRTIGYIGLLFLMIAQIRLAVHAHRQIQRCRGTEWFSLALFVGIPLVALPIFFVFVFGTFMDASAVLFIGHGVVRLLENNLPLPAYVLRRRGNYILGSRLALAEAGSPRA